MSSKTKAEKSKRRKMQPITGPEDWNAWQIHLAKRKRPAPPAEVIPCGKHGPLEWGLPESVQGSDSQQLVATLDAWCRQSKAAGAEVVDSLESWLAAADAREVGAGFGLECLAWTYALLPLAEALPSATWTQALDQLVKIASEAASAPSGEEALAEQLLAVELPLTLAYLFPELPACDQLGEPAGRRLSAGIHDLLDGDGLPRARHLPLLRGLLACWTRSCYLARAADIFKLKGDERLMFEWLVRRGLLLTRHDGSAVFSVTGGKAEAASLFDAALTLAGDTEDFAVADQVLPGRKAARKRTPENQLYPESAANSEWAEIAVLRPDWMRGGEHLVLTFHDRAIRAELNCGATTVWSGDWTPQVTVDGKLLDPSGDWEQNCWNSDDDVDFLELELPLQDGWRIQRQMVFARQERFLYVADAVLGEHAGNIAYRSCLPLSDSVGFEPAEESHEGFLVNKKHVALVLPLALPEWRTAPSDGSLQTTERGLQLAVTRRAQRLYAPLFIDLNRRRIKREATWRQLTVAERLEIQPAESAVGYRVQVGKEQWLFYRSLAAPASRTLLGQNLANEFYAGRFDEDGEADEMIAIDPVDEE